MNIIEKYASALSSELAEVRIYDSEKKQSKERDIFRALLQKNSPDIYENAINDLILGVEADLV